MQIGFDTQVDEGPQILHVGSNHWVTVLATVSGFQCADSLRQRGVHQQVKALCDQLWAGKTVTNIGRVQQQQGSTDCGLFAIAFAEAMLRGVDVRKLKLDQSRMREHLVQCFGENKIKPFPETDHAEYM